MRNMHVTHWKKAHKRLENGDWMSSNCKLANDNNFPYAVVAKLTLLLRSEEGARMEVYRVGSHYKQPTCHAA